MMKKQLVFLIQLLLLFMGVMFPIYGQSHAQETPTLTYSKEERENINVYKLANAAVVSIQSPAGTGTGCIIDPAGIIVTNKHVIGRTYTVNISLADDSRYTASVIDVDNDDLALLKINANRKFPYVKVGDSAKVEVGQKVLAIGNPFGFERTLTTGIVSRIDRQMNRIQTDAAINPGNSGGPLLNSIGELIGINQAIVNPSGRSSAGIGFAIPANTVRKLLAMSKNARILSASAASQSMLNQSQPFKTIPQGPQQAAPQVVYQNKVLFGIAGQNLSQGNVIITGVAPGSPAQRAGLKYRDIILSVDSVQVKTFDDIGFALNKKNPGDQINILYMRNGMVNNAMATLVPRS